MILHAFTSSPYWAAGTKIPASINSVSALMMAGGMWYTRLGLDDQYIRADGTTSFEFVRPMSETVNASVMIKKFFLYRVGQVAAVERDKLVLKRMRIAIQLVKEGVMREQWAYFQMPMHPMMDKSLTARVMWNEFLNPLVTDDDLSLVNEFTGSWTTFFHARFSNRNGSDALDYFKEQLDRAIGGLTR